MAKFKKGDVVRRLHSEGLWQGERALGIGRGSFVTVEQDASNIPYASRDGISEVGAWRLVIDEDNYELVTPASPPEESGVYVSGLSYPGSSVRIDLTPDSDFPIRIGKFPNVAQLSLDEARHAVALLNDALGRFAS